MQPVSEYLEWKQLSDVMNAFIRTEVLTAACGLGLFDHLACVRSATAAELAAHFDLEEQGVRILLMGCKQAGLVDEPERGRFAASRLSVRFLTTASHESMLNFVRFVREVQQKTCSTLLASLRQRTPVGLRELGAEPGETLYNLNAHRKGAAIDFHAAMSEYSRIVEPPALPELAEHRRLLDVGGGEGIIAERICREHPRLVCTILDLPSVHAIVAERAHRGELGLRIEAFSANVFTDPWPPAHDSILFSHFVEIFDSGTVQLLYRRAYQYLPIGGRVLIWTLVAPCDGEVSLQAVKSSVYFLTTAGGGGMTYAAEDHASWLRSSGFTVERIETHASTSHNLIVAVKAN